MQQLNKIKMGIIAFVLCLKPKRVATKKKIAIPVVNLNKTTFFVSMQSEYTTHFRNVIVVSVHIKHLIVDFVNVLCNCCLLNVHLIYGTVNLFNRNDNVISNIIVS